MHWPHVLLVFSPCALLNYWFYISWLRFHSILCLFMHISHILSKFEVLMHTSLPTLHHNVGAKHLPTSHICGSTWTWYTWLVSFHASRATNWVTFHCFIETTSLFHFFHWGWIRNLSYAPAYVIESCLDVKV